MSESKGHDPRFIANHFIVQHPTDGLTPMQVLKLVYIAHGYSLGLGHGPLVHQEPQAWEYGPVFPCIYFAMKRQKADRSIKSLLFPAVNTEINDSQKVLIQNINKVYGKYDGITLSEMCHTEGSPWYETWNSGTGEGSVIKDDIIKKYYENKVKQNNENNK